MTSKNISFIMQTIARIDLETFFAIIKLMHIIAMQGDTPFDEKIATIEANGFSNLSQVRKALCQLTRWGYIDYTTSSKTGKTYSANTKELKKILRYFNKRLSFLPLYKDS